MYVEIERTEALYLDFAMSEVILMEDAVNCKGTWYLYFPSTGEAHGALSEPDNPRLRLRLVDGKVVVLAGIDGCTWTEHTRRPDLPYAGRTTTVVILDTSCDYDHAFWYLPETGELSAVVP